MKPWLESAITYAFWLNWSNTGKLSGVNAPMPPDGSWENRCRCFSNRLRLWARPDVHIRVNSGPTTNSGLAGPYGSTATSAAGRSTMYGSAPPCTPPKLKSGLK